MNRRPAASRNRRTSALEIPAQHFDLRITLESGQAFHWILADDGYAGCIGDVPCWIAQRGGTLHVRGAGEAVVRTYFALDDDLPAISASWPTDPAMAAACEFAWGMRILRQPLWECLAAFITSSLKQVAHISAISHTIRSRWGESRDAAGRTVFSYPEPSVLAAASETDLRACGLGFRAKYLLNTARDISSGRVDLEALRERPIREARETLCSLPGVGEKIANCVLLFAYHRLEAFPIDVWIERVLQRVYFRRRKAPPARLRSFAAHHFGPYGGYAQQYLFHHVRCTRGACLPPPAKGASAKGVAGRAQKIR